MPYALILKVLRKIKSPNSSLHDTDFFSSCGEKSHLQKIMEQKFCNKYREKILLFSLCTLLCGPARILRKLPVLILALKWQHKELSGTVWSRKFTIFRIVNSTFIMDYMHYCLKPRLHKCQNFIEDSVYIGLLAKSLISCMMEKIQ